MRGIVDTYPGKQERKPILLSVEKTRRLLGVNYNAADIKKNLMSLGFKCETSTSSEEMMVIAPYWRNDINLDVDVMEEVARISGYDTIPVTLLSDELPRQNPSPYLALKRKVGIFLTGCGFQEVITNTFTNLETLGKLAPEGRSAGDKVLRIANPMTAEQENLRPDLRANLMMVVAANRRFQEGGIRLYEIGRIYLPSEKGLPDERDVLCGIICGLRGEKSWHGGDAATDFYDVKGVVEGLLENLGTTGTFENSDDASFHPGKQAVVTLDGVRVGVLGEIHPAVAQAFELRESVLLFEIDINALLPQTIRDRMYQPLAKFPAIVRDLALVVDNGVTHGSVQEIIKGFSLVEQVSLFDVYMGERMPAGKKSLAYRIVYRSVDHTLTDVEAEAVQQKLLKKLSQMVGASLRT